MTEDSLHDAASRGDLGRIKAILTESPALISSKDEEGKTPLHLAASRGQIEAIELLLVNNADVNAFDNRGYTPLDLVISQGYDASVVVNAVVRVLLDHNADPDAKNKDGGTALKHAEGKWRFTKATAPWHDDLMEVLKLLHARSGQGDEPLPQPGSSVAALESTAASLQSSMQSYLESSLLRRLGGRPPNSEDE